MHMTQNQDTQKLKWCLVASYDIQPGNKVGLLW